MKKLAIVFSILVAALFVTPGLIGFKVQGQYQQIIAGMQRGGLEVVSDDYQRGWFGSHAETKFKLVRPSGSEGESIEFTMLIDIVHGPLSPEGGLVLAFMGTSFKYDGKALFPGEENTILRTNIGLDGMGQTTIAVPALKLAGKPGRPEVQFSGADGNLSFDTGLTQVDIDVKMPGLWVGGENGESLKFAELELKSNSQSGLFSLLLGNGKLRVKQIAFSNPKQDVALTIDAISIAGDSSEDNGKLTLVANYSVDAVKVNNAVYGPMQFEMEITNIPAEVAAKLQQGMQEARSRGLSKEQENIAMMGLLMKVGPELLQANPKITIKRLFVKTPDGDIDGKLSIASNGLQWEDIGNVQAVLQKLKADASLTMPEKLFRAVVKMQAKAALMRQIEARKKMGQEIATPSDEELDKLATEMAGKQLEFLLQQELVKRDGTNISSKAKLGGGLLSVNGKTVPLR